MLEMRERTWSEGSWALALCAALVGCGDARPGQDAGGGLTGFDGTGDATVGDTEGESLDDGPRLDLPGSADDSPSDGEECVAVSEAAELVPLPADIIFVVDNSGSMGFEVQQIQLRMNEFSSQIIASGIDVHVVMISSYPGDDGNGICIDPPLGGGGCPSADENLPMFTHVNTGIEGEDAWQQLLAERDDWAGAVREGSVKHIVVITDDTSNMSWSDFHAQFTALFDPDDADYVHHSVVCHSACPEAANIGEDYITLSQNTGGVAADLCDQDFQAVFDVLATEVVGARLSCELVIPPPPDGMELDPDEVNLEFDDGMGGILPIGHVDSAADCPNVADGWHYDDPANPTMIVMCPQTCDEIHVSENGSIDIAFGCATIPAG